MICIPRAMNFPESPTISLFCRTSWVIPGPSLSKYAVEREDFTKYLLLQKVQITIWTLATIAGSQSDRSI